MNKYKTTDKIKINQLYHNYSISTKCFDGSTLYDMFLANQRAVNSAALKNKESSIKKKSQSDEETVNSISQFKPILEVSPYRARQSIFDLQKHTEPAPNFKAQKT